MTVVQKQFRAISHEELLTEDPDSQPNEILYEIMTVPQQGRLVSVENISFPRAQFTQKDINDKKMVSYASKNILKLAQQ